MKIQTYLIANGNSTILIWDCPIEKREEVVKQYLGTVEQVGFVEQENDVTKLVMMGDELCINGIIALASEIGSDGTILASGTKEVIRFQNQDAMTSITFSMQTSIKENIVLLEGIGYIVIDTMGNVSKKSLEQLAIRYSLPAFGAIIFTNGTLFPFVYVAQTNSLVEETACGSASIAYNMLTSKEVIQQPSGGTIWVKNTSSTFTVSANVAKIQKIYE